MSIIENFIEPRRLQLVWQKPDGSGSTRTRRVVGEIFRSNDNEFVFKYLKDTEDFIAAERNGFKGFPAFKISEAIYTQSVLDPFIRRLPPRNRDDFSRYLAMYRLPADYAGSDFALLGYTNAKLPGDGFELIPDLKDYEGPLQIMLEVAGTQYHNCELQHVSVDDEVRFEHEPNNEHDSSAICIFVGNSKLGHVPRPYLPAVRGWLNSEKVIGTIERLNGKPERPLVYLFLRVSK